MGVAPKRWVEIRRGPVNGRPDPEYPFTVTWVTYPREPGEPTDSTNPRRGARGMLGGRTFEEACRIAAGYALMLDRAWLRAKTKLDEIEDLRRTALFDEFLAKGEPE